MDQIKIGNFIAEMRKAQGLTQKELAEKLNLSDKAVSKWECGKGLPDNSIMLNLCSILQISVNELLSGERLSSCDYNKKAEENIMNLIQETRENKDNHKWYTIVSLGGELLLFFMIAFAIISNNGISGLLFFLDYPTLFIILGCIFLMLLSTRMTGAFLRAFRLFLINSNTASVQELEKSCEAVKLAIITAFAASALVTAVSIISLLHNISNPAALGPSASLACLSTFYSAVIALLLIPVVMKLKLQIKEL